MRQTGTEYVRSVTVADVVVGVSTLSAPAETAYKSGEPGVLAVYRAYQDERREHLDRLRTQLVAWGFPADHPVMILRASTLASRDIITGCGPLEGEKPPPGWRVSRESGFWVPRMVTNAGKQIAKELEAVQPPLHLIERLPGMPRFSMWANRIYAPGLLMLDDVVYLHWQHRPDEVDDAIWTEVKISEWYLAKEELSGREQQDQAGPAGALQGRGRPGAAGDR